MNEFIKYQPKRSSGDKEYWKCWACCIFHSKSQLARPPLTFQDPRHFLFYTQPTLGLGVRQCGKLFDKIHPSLPNFPPQRSNLPYDTILSGGMQAEVSEQQDPSKTKGQNLAKRKFFISVAPLTFSSFSLSIFPTVLPGGEAALWKTRDGKYQERPYMLSITQWIDRSSRSLGHEWAPHQPQPGPLRLLFCEMNKSLFFEATASQYFSQLLPKTFLINARGKKKNLFPTDSIIHVFANNRTNIIVKHSLSFKFFPG